MYMGRFCEQESDLQAKPVNNATISANCVMLMGYYGATFRW
jgi:hypothetical protein